MFTNHANEQELEKYYYIKLIYFKVLFENMLKYEDIKPEKLAYDRPSSKLIGILKKYYIFLTFYFYRFSFKTLQFIRLQSTKQ